MSAPPRRRRVGVAGVVLVLLVTLFGLLLGRLGQLQLVQGPDLARVAVTVNTRTVTEHALRGRILDRLGGPFVDNAFETVVTVQRSVLVDSRDGGRDLVTRVAAALGLPFEPRSTVSYCCSRPERPTTSSGPMRPRPAVTSAASARATQPSRCGARAPSGRG